MRLVGKQPFDAGERLNAEKERRQVCCSRLYLTFSAFSLRDVNFSVCTKLKFRSAEVTDARTVECYLSYLGIILSHDSINLMVRLRCAPLQFRFDLRWLNVQRKQLRSVFIFPSFGNHHR